MAKIRWTRQLPGTNSFVWKALTVLPTPLRGWLVAYEAISALRGRRSGRAVKQDWKRELAYQLAARGTRRGGWGRALASAALLYGVNRVVGGKKAYRR